MTKANISVVTIDTASIQSYVFASNKLKENIGASYIIEELLYQKLMVEAMQKASGDSTDFFQEWRKLPPNPKIAMFEVNGRKAEVAYIGGGNCMLFFENRPTALDFIREYTETILQYFPGVRLVFGQIDQVSKSQMEGTAFQKLRDDLRDSMTQCRNQSFAPSVVYKPGIVVDCPASGEGASFEEDGAWISALSKVKLQAARQASRAVHERYQEQLGDHFALTSEIDLFGQPQEKGYVAVVHADGNGIGQTFKEVKGLAGLRNLSRKVSRFADKLMKDLIEYAVGFFEKERVDKNSIFDLKDYGPEKDDPEWLKNGGRKILPIRPILVAGDDITFVCEGRLGIHLAAKLLEYFEKAGYTACAGIAICKTHYPFFKAYSLAESLCDRSKKLSKKSEKKDSLLHFLSIPSGFSGDLDEVLEQQFSIQGKPLLNGPYRLTDDDNSLADLKSCLTHYLFPQNKNPWPRNKIMQMREIFRKSESAQKLFLEEMKARGLEFHEGFNGFWEKKSSKNSKTASIIYDMIQMSDHYPQNLLNYEH